MDRTFNTSTFNTKSWNKDNFPKEIQLAREQAMLGEYLDALAQYKAIIKKIQILMTQNFNNMELYNKWEQLQVEVEDELKNVEQMIELSDRLENGRISSGLDSADISPSMGKNMNDDLGGIMGGGMGGHMPDSDRNNMPIRSNANRKQGNKYDD